MKKSLFVISDLINFLHESKALILNHSPKIGKRGWGMWQDTAGKLYICARDSISGTHKEQ